MTAAKSRVSCVYTIIIRKKKIIKKKTGGGGHTNKRAYPVCVCVRDNETGYTRARAFVRDGPATAAAAGPVTSG